MTSAELLREHRRFRELWFDGDECKSRVRESYERYFRQACVEGRPPDSLVKINGPENERFFELVIAGPDGHNYWIGPNLFRRNSGHKRQPRYWWYEHLHGNLPRGSLKPVCGELHCITPTHQRFVDWSELRRLYTDEQLLGAVQVIVMRLRHSPTAREYNAERGRGPTSQIIGQRFGSWSRALKAAGCEPVQKKNYSSAEQCVEGLKFVAGLIGHPPNTGDYERHETQLREQGLPVTVGTIRKHLAPTWDGALEKAGLR